MREKIILDGVELQLKPVEQDGKITQVIQQQDTGVTQINQSTELGETLRELNKDEIDMRSRMSDIDMRARLYPVEISSILALDSLVAFGVCPTKALSFTRQKKRLSVSSMGLGRQEIVDIVGRKREEEQAKTGFGDKMKGFFGMGK